MKPTTDQAKALACAFEHFNATLFHDALPDCMVVFSRNANIIGGYYSPALWEMEDELDPENPVRIAEIAINVNIMKKTDRVSFYCVLVHEMLHHWQECCGHPGTEGYHNQEYVKKATETGLLLDNGQGGQTGKSVTQTLIEGSPMEKALRSLPVSAIIPWEAVELHLPDADTGGGGQTVVVTDGAGQGSPTARPRGYRAKYTCTVCGLNAWAKPGAMLTCGKDSRNMVEQKTGGEE